jgi:hypothetical protein
MVTNSGTTTAPKPKAAKAKTDEPKAAKPPKYHPCECLAGTGKKCDGITTRAFARGHDARMASRLATDVANGDITKAEAAKIIRDAGGGDLLVGKMEHSAELRIEKNKPKEPGAPKAATKEARPASSKPAAGMSAVGQAVTVAHGDKTYKAVIVRDAEENLRARHRHQGKNCDHDVES